MDVLKRNNTKYCAIENYPQHGVRFIDFTPTIMDAEAFHLTAGSLNLLLKSEEFDYIIAPEARGFIWGSVIAYKLGIPMILARKKGKIPKALVGYGTEYKTEYSTDYLEIPFINLEGKKVLYVDDVYATGGTYEVCKDLVARAGGNVTKGIVLYDVGIKENEEISSLFKGADL